MRRLLGLLLAAGLACTACSSAPPKTDTATDVKNRAAEATDFGNQNYRQGRYDLALSFFTQALELNVSVDNEAGVVQSYNSIGRVYMALDRIDLAEETLLKALPRARAKGSPDLIFVAANNLGELYLKKGDPQRAIGLFDQALELSSGKLTPAQMGVLNHNLGTAFKATGDLPRARTLLEKSLSLNLGAKLDEEAAADYYMLASVYSKQGDYDSARKNLLAALDLDKKIENSLGIAKDLNALGIVAGKSRDAEAAFDFFQRAYLVYTTIGIPGETRRALATLVEAAESAGKTGDAAEYRAALEKMGK